MSEYSVLWIAGMRQKITLDSIHSSFASIRKQDTSANAIIQYTVQCEHYSAWYLGQPNQTVFIELSYGKLKYLPIGGNMLVDREAYNYNFKGLFNQYSMKSILL